MAKQITVAIDIKPGRRVGNTTRIVDKSIQYLFEGYSVIVKDHYDNGFDNLRLLHIIRRRLENEHPGQTYRVYRDEITLA